MAPSLQRSRGTGAAQAPGSRRSPVCAGAGRTAAPDRADCDLGAQPPANVVVAGCQPTDERGKRLGIEPGSGIPLAHRKPLPVHRSPSPPPGRGACCGATGHAGCLPRSRGSDRVVAWVVADCHRHASGHGRSGCPGRGGRGRPRGAGALGRGRWHRPRSRRSRRWRPSRRRLGPPTRCRWTTTIRAGDVHPAPLPNVAERAPRSRSCPHPLTPSHEGRSRCRRGWPARSRQ